MTASGTDGDRTPRGGSLLSLAPRTPARRATRPALNPMLAALARSAEPPAETPPAPVAEKEAVATAEASVESITAEEAVTVEEPMAEDVPAEEVRNEDVPAESAPAMEPSPAELSPAAEIPETAKGLVARLRRQFVEGLPEGRAEEAKISAKTAEPKAEATPRRSALDEVRFRLSEFRTEILVRAAGRGKPSRRE